MLFILFYVKQNKKSLFLQKFIKISPLKYLIGGSNLGTQARSRKNVSILEIVLLCGKLRFIFYGMIRSYTYKE